MWFYVLSHHICILHIFQKLNWMSHSEKFKPSSSDILRGVTYQDGSIHFVSLQKHTQSNVLSYKAQKRKTQGGV